MRDIFEYTFEQDGLYTKYARSLPSVNGQEFHDYCEFIFFLGGEARFISKNVSKNLKEGSVIFVPKNTFHQLVVKDNSYTRYILGFNAGSEFLGIEQKLGTDVILIEQPNEMIKGMVKGLIEISKQDISNQEKAVYIKASVVHLLFEFKKQTNQVVKLEYNVSKIIHDALLLIDDEYVNPITVKSLARKLHVSESLLSHKFKREMNISICQYISKKRLAVARDLIKSGIKITAAAEQSGFTDYSCFYRLYKKQYKKSPSEE